MVILNVTLKLLVDGLKDFNVLLTLEHLLREEEALVAGFPARDASNEGADLGKLDELTVGLDQLDLGLRFGGLRVICIIRELETIVDGRVVAFVKASGPDQVTQGGQ